MEWIEGEMFTDRSGRAVEFSDPVFEKIPGNGYRVVTGKDTASYLVYNDSGRPAASCDDECENIIHRPPVPAPAACEHERDDEYHSIGAGEYRCKKCRQWYASPSPSPVPDSVEAAIKLRDRAAAEEFVEDSPTKRDDLRAFMDFLTAYISEQTAQRKAAGELAEQVRYVIKNHGGFVELYGTLAADALCRAGKDGGK